MDENLANADNDQQVQHWEASYLAGAEACEDFYSENGREGLRELASVGDEVETIADLLAYTDGNFPQDCECWDDESFINGLYDRLDELLN